MQIFDFSFEPFVSVCETDKSYTYTNATTSNFSSLGALQNYQTGEVVSSSVEIQECRNPFTDFWVFTVFIIGFIFIVYKISCMVGD